jgi:hypothetical protein
MFMSRHQSAGQSNFIRVANKSFEGVAKFKCLESTLTDQNCIPEEIEHTKFGEWLLQCSSESFVFPSAV